MVLNWKEIKEKCPKAWDKLFEMFSDGIIENFIEFENEGFFYSDIIRFEDKAPSLMSRILYDFFDENDLVVTIGYWSEEQMPFYWDIAKWGMPASVSLSSNADFNGRTEAETEAFNKAFEILENKLTKCWFLIVFYLYL